jgi:hypothetical protein
MQIQSSLTEKSSAQTCQSDSLTQSTLLSLKTLGESKIRAKGRGEGRLECLGVVLDEGWWAMNEWATVRREERAIYTHRQIQPFRSESSAADRWDFRLYCRTLFTSQSTGLARLSLELSTAAGTSNSRDFWLPSGLPTDKQARRLSPKAPGLLAHAGTFSNQKSTGNI